MIELGLVAVSGRYRNEHGCHSVAGNPVAPCHFIDDPATFVCQLLHNLTYPCLDMIPLASSHHLYLMDYHTVSTGDTT